MMKMETEAYNVAGSEPRAMEIDPNVKMQIDCESGDGGSQVKEGKAPPSIPMSETMHPEGFSTEAESVPHQREPAPHQVERVPLVRDFRRKALAVAIVFIGGVMGVAIVLALGRIRMNANAPSQQTSAYQDSPYPDCHVDCPSCIGDGWCNGREYNMKECGWDGGDCVVEGYPDCHVDYPERIGDGYCDGEEYDTEECGWDGGDCLEFNELYPDCRVDDPSLIGDGSCDGGQYNTEECGWDGGDCLVEGYPNCHVDIPFDYPSFIGDGICNGGKYNTEECGWDGGDCLEFNELYPDCRVDVLWAFCGGSCDGGQYNTEECGWDGGDCIQFNELYPNCHVDVPFFVGDGDCDDRSNTEECGYDGGDCCEETCKPGEYWNCEGPWNRCVDPKYNRRT